MIALCPCPACQTLLHTMRTGVFQPVKIWGLYGLPVTPSLLQRQKGRKRRGRDKHPTTLHTPQKLTASPASLMLIPTVRWVAVMATTLLKALSLHPFRQRLFQGLQCLV
jgi:hypothetical protein